MFGEEGVLLVLYLGTGKASIKSGALPGFRYTFTPERNEGYIDERDWPVLADLIDQDGGGPLFEKAE